MTRSNRWASCAALGLAVALGPVAAAGQELPPDIQMDLYLVQVDRYVQSEDWAAALEALDIVFLLQADQGIETPAELWFTHARAALEAGYPQTAITSATRYLQEAGREGQDYAAALVLLDEAITRAEGGPTPTPAPTPAATPAPTREATPTPTPGEPAPDPVAEAGGGLEGLTVLFPVVGLNAATMAFTSSGPVTMNASRLNGLAGGFAVAFPVPGPVDVQIGAQFAQKGASVALGDGNVGGNAEINFESVDFTALARISAAQMTNLPVYALVGPYASFETDCRVVLDASAGTTRFSSSDDCRNANLDTQSIDFGVSGGLGFEVGAGETRINVGVLYNYGLQDIDKTVGETARNRVLNIHAGIARTF